MSITVIDSDGVERTLDPPTAANQAIQITAEQAILAKLLAAPATEAKQDALAALIGEVQASPTSNTLLDRLKAIQTALGAAPTGAATEAKQDSQITLLTTQAGYLDGLETGQASILAKLIAAPATEAKQDTQVTALGGLTETAPGTDTASSGLNGRLQRIAQRLTSLIALLPTALGANGGLKIEGVASGTAIPISSATLATAAKQPALGTAGTPSADVLTVQGSTSGTPLPTKAARSTAAAKANVPGAAVSTTILASNAARLGASIYNDSAAILYLDTSGGTASSTSHTLAMGAGSFYELPFGYTGAITGIWASATGAARVLEYT